MATEWESLEEQVYRRTYGMELDGTLADYIRLPLGQPPWIACSGGGWELPESMARVTILAFLLTGQNETEM